MVACTATALALLGGIALAPSAASATDTRQWPVVAAADAAASAGDEGSIRPLIIGGHGATEAYPWMVSLQFNHPSDPNWHFCGGTLVSRRFVVTNAHCITYDDGSPVDPTEFGIHVRIGSHDRTSGGIVANVAKILPHPQWDWGTGPDAVADIALLYLEDYIQLQHIEIAPKTVGFPGTRSAAVRLLGWGVTEPDGSGPVPIQLQELDTMLVAKRLCSGGLPISEGELCIANPNGTDGPCYGDSGGPALQKIDRRWKLIGGTSRGTTADCGVGHATYTDVPYYRPWIVNTMRTGTVSPPVSLAVRANAQEHYWMSGA